MFLQKMFLKNLLTDYRDYSRKYSYSLLLKEGMSSNEL